MIVALDTSVLVAAVLASHPRHPPAHAWVASAAAGRIEARVALHALAETWAVLTRAPLPHPLDAGTANALISALRRHVCVVCPDERTYDAAVRRCADRGARGGAVYDALHLVTAEQGAAELLLTDNPKDFERLRDRSSPPIARPGDRPAPRATG